MDLVIDLGNTNMKAATFKNRQIIAIESVTSQLSQNLIRFILENKYESAIISAVTEIPEEILHPVNESTKKIIILNSATPLPLMNDYKTTETLGPDRLALAVAGYSKFPKYHVLIIDAGTCITYDLVNDKKTYLGGAISPGIDMRFRALNQFTMKLPLIEKQDTTGITGKTTKDSILSGVINAVIFEIEGFISEYKSIYKELKVILTGGDSIFLANKLKNCNFAEPNLLLYGLQEILLYNK